MERKTALRVVAFPLFVDLALFDCFRCAPVLPRRKSYDAAEYQQQLNVEDDIAVTHAGSAARRPGIADEGALVSQATAALRGLEREREHGRKGSTRT